MCKYDFKTMYFPFLCFYVFFPFLIFFILFCFSVLHLFGFTFIPMFFVFFFRKKLLKFWWSRLCVWSSCSVKVKYWGCYIKWVFERWIWHWMCSETRSSQSFWTSNGFPLNFFIINLKSGSCNLDFKWVPLNFFLINLFELQLFNIHSHCPFIVTVCYCCYLI